MDGDVFSDIRIIAIDFKIVDVSAILECSNVSNPTPHAFIGDGDPNAIGIIDISISRINSPMRTIAVPLC